MSEQLTEETIRQMAEQEVARYTSRIKELEEQMEKLKEEIYWWRNSETGNAAMAEENKQAKSRIKELEKGLQTIKLGFDLGYVQTSDKYILSIILKLLADNQPKNNQ